jgi:hypothetical protein
MGKKAQRGKKAERGVAQGLSISNILASIYMKKLDKNYLKRKGFVYFRYVDDILILCKKEDADSIKKEIVEDINALKLEVHAFKSGSNKSTVGCIGEEMFQYLGFEFDGDLISVRESSVDRLRERILHLFYEHKESSDNTLYKKVNLKITGCIYDGKQYGWLHFFSQMTDLELLYHLDWYVKKCFLRFNRKYDEKKIKRFTTTYFKLKQQKTEKLNASTYIPRYGTETVETPQVEIEKPPYQDIFKLREDVEYYGY